MVPATPSPGRRSPALRWILLAFVALLALDHYTHHLAHTPGIDFYQYWAVPTARRASAEPLGSPYADSGRYAEVLAAIAERSGDPRLAAVTEYRREPGFASDPLLYVLGAWLPSDYTTALKLYQTLQALALALALSLLARRAEAPGLETAIFGLLMYLYYMPVLSELRVLNTNAFQLAALAAALAWLGRRPHAVWADGAALCALVFVAFLKPLWAPLVGLALVYLVVTRGLTALWRPLAAAGVAGAALFAWPAAVFGAGVWGDWYRTVYGDDPDHLVYTVVEGNRSTPLVLSRWLGWELSSAILLVVLVLIATIAVTVLGLRGGQERPSARAAIAALGRALTRRAELTLGLGVVALLALSPLVWWHYYTLALLPLFALLGPAATRGQIVLGGLSVLLASGRLGPVYAWFGDADRATIVGVSLAWVPLWLGLLVLAARPSDSRRVE